MQQARIAELLRPFLSAKSGHSTSSHTGAAQAGEESAVLPSAQLQSISMYIDILLHWNNRINLTAIRNEEEIVTRHFGESLFVARQLFPAAERSAASRLADLGSGAGFPGIPIKLWAPNIALTLIESNHKKATFLREVVRILTLTSINIQNVRAETLSPASFDVITLRAVERFADVLPVAAALLRPAGRLALLVGDSQRNVARATLPTLAWGASIPIPESQSRFLMTGVREP
jgi:16S rRNA (guanine527-N7)-methyltransferase